MKIGIKLFIVTGYFMLSCKSDKQEPPPTPPTTPPTAPSWNFETTPVWVDEFDSGSVPNPNKWVYDVGGDGWGNHELEYYTSGNNNNANLDSGILHIVAKKESINGMNYSSARMLTKGKGEWLYGRFEIRARVPRGRGTWPAIWLLPSENYYGGWPSSGEIDIMEHVGFDQNNIHFTVHNATFFGGNGKGASKIIPTASDSFHVYRCDWTPQGIRGYIDGEEYFEYPNNNGGSAYYPYDRKFFMILNVAIGGDWGGAQGVDDTIFPVQMDVDYVKVYNWKP